MRFARTARTGKYFLAPVMAAALIVACQAAYAAVLYETDFTGETQGGLPTNWEVLVGATGDPGWRIDTSNNFRYDQVSTGTARYTGPLADGTSSAALENFTVVTALRKSTDTTNRTTGLVARLQDSGSFYQAQLLDTSAFRLYRHSAGSTTQQLGSTITTAESYVSGQTWRLSMTFEGNQITSRLFNHNNVLMGTITDTDSTFTSGSVGLRAQNVSVYETFAVHSDTSLATYRFTSGQDGGLGASQDRAPHATASDFGWGAAGTNWDLSSGHENVFARSDTTAGNAGDAVTLGSYFSFTVTPDAGYHLQLDRLEFDTAYYRAAGSTSGSAEAGFFVRSSLDGFGANIGDTMIQAYQNVETQPDVIWSFREVSLADAAFQNITDPVEFRIYVYDDSTDVNRTPRLDNVVLHGLVVPEPGAWLLLLSAAACGLLVRRRRGKE